MVTDRGSAVRQPRVAGGGLRLALVLGCLAAALAIWQLVSAVDGGGTRQQTFPDSPEPAGTRSSTAPAPAPEPLREIPGRGLALGITEPNPALVWSPTARPSVPAPFERWRRELGKTRPAVYRLMVSWRHLQPQPGGPVVLDAPQSGCLRARGPCAPWAGVREQLAALASRQREGGWEGMVVLLDTPEWAAAPPACEAPGSEPRARAPRPEALVHYQAVVRALLAAAAEEGATLRYWSAWNEPNHAYFLSRQRSDCDGTGDARRTPSAEAYAALVRALDTVLAAAPGTRRVLGELAASRRDGRNTSVSTFIRALPRDLVCASPVFAQHGYAGGWDPVADVERALAGHGCPTRHRVWITETGAGLPSASLSEGAGSVTRPRACRELHARLRKWWEDPRVDVAVQYTWREDDLFRVGLVSTDLTETLPTLGAWQAWSRRPTAAAPPPRRDCPDGD